MKKAEEPRLEEDGVPVLKPSMARAPKKKIKRVNKYMRVGTDYEAYDPKIHNRGQNGRV